MLTLPLSLSNFFFVSYLSKYHLISHKYHSRALSSLILRYILSICLKYISLKNITCRLKEDSFLELLPLRYNTFSPRRFLFFSFSLFAGAVSPFPLNISLRVQIIVSLFFFFFFFFSLDSCRHAYRISLNLNNTQLTVSVDRLLLEVSHICFAASRSSRRRPLSLSLSLSLSFSRRLLAANRDVCMRGTVSSDHLPPNRLLERELERYHK